MMLFLLFTVLLILSFAVLVYLLKPTAIEKAVSRQLSEIEQEPSSTSGAASTILKQEAVRTSAVGNTVFAGLPWAGALTRLMKHTGKPWNAGNFFFFSLLAAVVVGWLAVLISNMVIGIAIGIGVELVPYAYLIVLREARRHAFDKLMPEAVDLMARGLRAGHSIAGVIEMVGKEIADPLGSEFRALHEEQTLGLPIRDAMMNLVERMPLDDMRFLATAVLLQKESGGNLAQILDKTAAVIRERARLRGQIQIYTAQGRITAWILCAAPFFMFALINTVNHAYEKTLFSTKLGMYMVYGGLAAMLLGILTIRKIIDVKV